MCNEKPFSAAVTFCGLSYMNPCLLCLRGEGIFNDVGTGSVIVPDSYFNNAIWDFGCFFNGIVPCFGQLPDKGPVLSGWP